MRDRSYNAWSTDDQDIYPRGVYRQFSAAHDSSMSTPRSARSVPSRNLEMTATGADGTLYGALQRYIKFSPNFTHQLKLRKRIPTAIAPVDIVLQAGINLRTRKLEKGWWLQDRIMDGKIFIDNKFISYRKRFKVGCFSAIEGGIDYNIASGVWTFNLAGRNGLDRHPQKLEIPFGYNATLKVRGNIDFTDFATSVEMNSGASIDSQLMRQVKECPPIPISATISRVDLMFHA